MQAYDWSDALRLNNLLSEEERLIRDTAHAYCQEQLMPRVKEAFAQSSEAGMQSFDSALLELYRAGKIGMEEALANADSRANLEANIHFQ